MLRDTVVELIGFGNALTVVVGFFAVLEVAEEPVWILGFEMPALLNRTSLSYSLEATRAFVIDQQYRHSGIVPGQAKSNPGYNPE